LNSHSVSSWETRLRKRIESLKAHLLLSAERPEAFGGLLFSNKCSIATLQPDSDLTSSNGILKLYMLECIIWLNGSFFSGDDWNIVKQEVNTYLMTQSLPLNLMIFFFICTSVVHAKS
jgi:hypothetical protein